MARWGGRWALVPSVAQLPVGLWTLIALPAAAQSQLMGSSTVGSLLFIGSLGAALWLINDLVHVAMGEIARAMIVRAMCAMLFTVVLMTAMQQQARQRTVGAVRHALRGVPEAGIDDGSADYHSEGDPEKKELNHDRTNRHNP